nr:hypothetical protein [Actinoplanes atraurantiacus]
MTDLRLDRRARGYDDDRLAAEILRTMRRAQAELAGAVAEIAHRTVGADSPTGRSVVSSFDSRFPRPVEGDDADDR